MVNTADADGLQIRDCILLQVRGRTWTPKFEDPHIDNASPGGPPENRRPLSLEKHASAVCAACFFHLRQIRRVRQSLDAGSAATVIHTFVTSRVDYCNAVLAGSPRVTTDKLQRVMNSAARVVSNTRKFNGGLSWLLYDELHWLDVTD